MNIEYYHFAQTVVRLHTIAHSCAIAQDCRQLCDCTKLQKHHDSEILHCSCYRLGMRFKPQLVWCFIHVESI